MELSGFAAVLQAEGAAGVHGAVDVGGEHPVDVDLDMVALAFDADGGDGGLLLLPVVALVAVGRDEVMCQVPVLFFDGADKTGIRLWAWA